MAVLASNMSAFVMSIKGPMPHVTCGLAQVTAQKEPLVRKLLGMLVALLLLVHAIITARGALNKPGSCLGHSLRSGKVLPGQKSRRLVQSTTQSRWD